MGAPVPFDLDRVRMRGREEEEKREMLSLLCRLVGCDHLVARLLGLVEVQLDLVGLVDIGGRSQGYWWSLDALIYAMRMWRLSGVDAVDILPRKVQMLKKLLEGVGGPGVVSRWSLRAVGYLQMELYSRWSVR